MPKKKDKKTLPIERIPNFYSAKSMETDMLYITQYYTTDINMKITLYRVNIITSQIDDLYGESLPVDKKFLPPVELTVLLDIENTGVSNTNDIITEQLGKLVFDVLEKELNNKNCDITRGDYISYYDGKSERYFEVVSANNMNTSSEQTLVFRTGYYRHISCSYIKDDVIMNFD
jgi:hypothetical protein